MDNASDPVHVGGEKRKNTTLATKAAPSPKKVKNCNLH